MAQSYKRNVQIADCKLLIAKSKVQIADRNVQIARTD
jgi:hypothetical protein